MIRSWRPRRAKDTPSSTANNAARHKSGMKPCQFSLGEVAAQNQNELLNKEMLQSSCLKQNGTVPTILTLLLDQQVGAVLLTQVLGCANFVQAAISHMV